MKIYESFPTDYNFDLLLKPTNYANWDWMETRFFEPIPNVGSSSTGHDPESTQRIATAYSKLHDYTTAGSPSRPGSPQAARAHERWLRELREGKPLRCPRVVINVLINLFQQHVAATFETFAHFTIGTKTPKLLYIAMAATGGLYCDSLGSQNISKWLYSVARRKLLRVVSDSLFTTLHMEVMERIV